MYFFRCKEIYAVVLILIILFTISFYPIYQNYKHTPYTNEYIGTEIYSLDYLMYQSMMLKGYDGYWQNYLNHLIDPKDRINTPIVFLKYEYLLMGHFARIIQFDPLIMMKVSKILFCLILLFTFIWVIWKTFQKTSERITALVLTLFPTPLGLTMLIPGFNSIAYPYIGNIINQHLFTKQHHQLANICTIISISIYFNLITKKVQTSKIILLCIFTLLSSWFFSPSPLFFIGLLPIMYVLMYANVTQRKIILEHKRRILYVSCLYAICTIIPTIYNYYFYRFITHFANTELPGFLYPNILSTLLSLGPTYILSIICLPFVLRSTNIIISLLYAFILVHPIAATSVENLFNIGTYRLFEIPYQIVYGIMAVYGIKYIYTVIHSKIPLISFNMISMLIIIICILGSSNMYLKYLQHDCLCNGPPYSFSYPEKTTMDVIRWLRNDSKGEGGVMTGFQAGTLIPAFSGNEVYLDWWMKYNITHYDMLMLIQSFYNNNNLSLTGAKKMLDMYNISYIYYGIEEQELNWNKFNLNSYPFLTEVYKSGPIQLYKVNK